MTPAAFIHFVKRGFQLQSVSATYPNIFWLKNCFILLYTHFIQVNFFTLYLLKYDKFQKKHCHFGSHFVTDMGLVAM